MTKKQEKEIVISIMVETVKRLIKELGWKNGEVNFEEDGNDNLTKIIISKE